jgi:hypothetical protein
MTTVWTAARRWVHLDVAVDCWTREVPCRRRIGKEANKLEDVQAGLVAQLGDVVNDYGTGGDGVFHRDVLPRLGHFSGRQLANLVGTDRRTIDRIRAGGPARTQLRHALIALAVPAAR